jgi:hypothetical protein
MAARFANRRSRAGCEKTFATSVASRAVEWAATVVSTVSVRRHPRDGSSAVGPVEKVVALDDAGRAERLEPPGRRLGVLP